MANYKKPPTFGDKPYERYIEELNAWTFITELEKDKQAIAVALSFPENDESHIRDKVFSEINMDDLKEEDGIKTLITFMDGIFKKDELTQVYDAYIKFDRFKRTMNDAIENYIIEFEKLYVKTKRYKMELPQSVLAFKLLDGTLLEHKDRQLVLTAVNYSNVDTLFSQMKVALKKFFGEQSKPALSADDSSIKYESALAAQHEECNMNYRRRPNFTRGNNTRQHFRGGSSNINKTQTQRRKTNPVDSTGNPMTCNICQSIMHFSRDCPHSYENMKKQDIVQQPVLFTGESEELSVLLCESVNSAILDSGCSSTVAGCKWMNFCIDSLSDSDKKDVISKPSDTVFKFGGGERLCSLKKMIIPCYLAGKKCMIETDIVNSDIPLLISKSAMKKAEMKLDVVNDKAEIFGKEVNLENTSSGHYSIPLNEVTVSLERCLFTECRTLDEKKKKVVKLHKQLAHPSAHRLKTYYLKMQNFMILK